MTKRAFKVGERVRFYDGDYSEIGVVKKLNDNGTLDVDEPGTGIWCLHPKQCRRLKPKRKPRRVWMLAEAIREIEALDPTSALLAYNCPGTRPGEWIEFREVLPKRGGGKG